MTDEGAAVERADSDDYDLLTYGEAAARLAELIAEERKRLSALRGEAHPDPERVRDLEERIDLLVSSDTRYRRQASTSETFARRFRLYK